jgi:RNA polymerase sigma factor (sigma-70 family)
VVAQHSDSAVLDGLAGDLDAGYAAFVEAHARDVYSTALRLSGSRAEADDLAQDTFVRAYRALGRFDAERVRALEARPWLLTITVNLWRNRVRATARRPKTTIDDGGPESADPAPGPDAAAEAAETSEALVRLLRELPEHHRVPVVLRHVVGLSYAEISSVLACPEGTAKANVARGLDRLRLLAAGSLSRSPTRRVPASRAAVAASRPRPAVHRKEAP